MSARAPTPTRALAAAGLLAGALVALTACPATPSAESDPKSDPKSPPASTDETRAKPSARGPEFIHAPAGEVAAVVAAERRRAEAEGRQLLVYVGASWCEPCQYFHDAVDGGALDEVFPTLRLLEFDFDADRDRLAAAGYASKMIPLFVAPAPDGRGGPRRMQGSIKGPGAVDEIRPRLEALLVAAAADG